MGGVDGAVLERLAKIMGYVRVTPGAKPGKRLKKRDKQRLLAAAAAAPSGARSCPPGLLITAWARRVDD